MCSLLMSSGSAASSVKWRWLSELLDSKSARRPVASMARRVAYPRVIISS